MDNDKKCHMHNCPHGADCVHATEAKPSASADLEDMAATLELTVEGTECENMTGIREVISLMRKRAKTFASAAPGIDDLRRFDRVATTMAPTRLGKYVEFGDAAAAIAAAREEARREADQAARKETRDYYEAKIADLFAQRTAGGDAVAYVPVHPRTGEMLWANTVPNLDLPHPSYEMRPLAFVQRPPTASAAAPTAQPTPERRNAVDAELNASEREESWRKAAQPTPPDDELAAFEAWAPKQGLSLCPGKFSAYYLADTAAAWKAWQARAALRQPGALPDDAEAWADAISTAAMYVHDHCVDGESHAEIIMNMKRPDFAALAAKQAGKEAPCAN